VQNVPFPTLTCELWDAPAINGHRPVSMREYHALKATAELDTPAAQRTPAFTDEWLRELVAWLERGPADVDWR
jgi:hypothetical protein